MRAGRPGYLTSIDLEALSSSGGAAARIHVLVRPGDFVSAESVLADVWVGDGDRERVRKAFSVESERTIANGAAFGFRQLTDIALRAISPSSNDPTTAVTCIGYVQAALVSLAAVAQRAAACGASSRGSQAEEVAREIASGASRREAGTQGDRAEIERWLLAALSQGGS